MPQPAPPDGPAPEAGAGPVTARAHVFVDDLEAPQLAPDDHHHLTRVLRLAPGSDVTVGDGDGGWRPGRLARDGRVEPTGGVVREARPEPTITVAFALVKGDRPELAVQKLTEVGVDRIVPFVAERGVVRWDEAKAERQRVRLTGIARQAAMQCRRIWLPQVDGVAAFGDVAQLPGATLADRDGDPPTLARPAVLVGPEGGWSARERAVGLPATRIGPHVLRAETASITAGALLVSLRNHLVIGAV